MAEKKKNNRRKYGLRKAINGKPKTGRKVLLMEESIRQRVFQAIALYGYRPKKIADFVGINQTTFLEWIEVGESHLATAETDSPYAKFVEDVRKARANAEGSTWAQILQRIQNGEVTATVTEVLDASGQLVRTIRTSTTRPVPVEVLFRRLEKLDPDVWGARIGLVRDWEREAEALGIDPAVLKQQLMGSVEPSQSGGIQRLDAGGDAGSSRDAVLEGEFSAIPPVPDSAGEVRGGGVEGEVVGGADSDSSERSEKSEDSSL